jgi:hypothetical protein
LRFRVRASQFLANNLAFVAIFAIAAPLTLAFAWEAVISSVGDDSVSYLTLARRMSPFASDPFTAPWAQLHGHFPPVFPMLLAYTGGAEDFLMAHLAVAAYALVALVLLYRYAALRLGSSRAGALLALLFLLTPSAWISMRGILSETLYLALSLAALLFHAQCVEKGARRVDLATFGLLLAACYLTRVAGITLILAYAAQLAFQAFGRRRIPAPASFIPFVPPIVLAILWIALRPQGDVDNYRKTLHGMLGHWLTDPGLLLSLSWNSVVGGWIASFAGASSVGLAARIGFGALGLAGIAGALLATRRNRLDGWYVLLSLAMITVWVFREDNTRRLLYPLLPLLLIHAAEALAAACAMLKRRNAIRLGLAVGWVSVAALVLPATLLVLQKALDHAPLIPGYAYDPAAMTEDYTTVNIAGARAAARQHAAILAGFESLEGATPPGSRVMWMRPEYVGLLSNREGVPWHFAWDRPTLAREILRTRTDYVIATRLSKMDVAGGGGDEFGTLVNDTPAYLRPSMVIANPESGIQEFVLLQVDRETLERYIAANG